MIRVFPFSFLKKQICDRIYLHTPKTMANDSKMVKWFRLCNEITQSEFRIEIPIKTKKKSNHTYIPFLSGNDVAILCFWWTENCWQTENSVKWYEYIKNASILQHEKNEREWIVNKYNSANLMKRKKRKNEKTNKPANAYLSYLNSLLFACVGQRWEWISILSISADSHRFSNQLHTVLLDIRHRPYLIEIFLLSFCSPPFFSFFGTSLNLISTEESFSPLTTCRK